MKLHIKKYGITVSDDEVRNVILGDNPPEYLKASSWIRVVFLSRAEYEAAIKDPRNKQNIVMVENAVRQQILGEKLRQLLVPALLLQMLISDGNLQIRNSN
ncbi:MAG: hypothetical protein IPJ75_15320 [Ignavibacteriales bacterium]|nr:hypothetical protein [Ignavibacteriales bacterium]